jgi:hypothetical protein
VEFIADDELVEITPKSIRVRKRFLKEHDRKRAGARSRPEPVRPVPMSHRKAVWVMVACALMWSIAGVVSRHLEAARGFEVTFWRSAFNALALVVLLGWLRGPARCGHAARGGRALWLSGAVLERDVHRLHDGADADHGGQCAGHDGHRPAVHGAGARFVLGHRLAARTWGAIALAGLGIAWMYGHEVSAGDAATCWARWWRWRAGGRRHQLDAAAAPAPPRRLPAATCCRRC